MVKRPIKHDVVYVGIDPGLSGALAWIDMAGNINTCKAPPTERDMWDMIRSISSVGVLSGKLIRVHAIIERMQPMPNSMRDGRATFYLSGSYHAWRMAMVATEIFKFEECRAQDWQKALGIPKRVKKESDTQWKNRLKARAQQLYPEEAITLATADAILIATFCQRKHEGTL